MNKFYLVGLIISITVIMMGCSNSRPSDSELMGLSGQVKGFEHEFVPEDEYGSVSMYFYNVWLLSHSEVEFDKGGFLTEQASFVDGQKIGVHKFEVDQKGYPLETTYKAFDSDDIYKIEFESEDDRALVIDGQLEGEGKGNTTQQVFYYDEDGYLLREAYEYEDGYEAEYNYTYKDGLLVEIEQEQEYSDDYMYKYTVEMIYEDGLLVEYIEIYETDGSRGVITFKYKDEDEKGNWTEAKVYQDDEYIGKFKRSYTYY